jgi:hypothetical protein
VILPKSTSSRGIALDLIVIARSEATKQSSASYAALGLLRFARNDGTGDTECYPIA